MKRGRKFVNHDILSQNHIKRNRIIFIISFFLFIITFFILIYVSGLYNEFKNEYINLTYRNYKINRVNVNDKFFMDSKLCKLLILYSENDIKITFNNKTLYQGNISDISNFVFYKNLIFLSIKKDDKFVIEVYDTSLVLINTIGERDVPYMNAVDDMYLSNDKLVLKITNGTYKMIQNDKYYIGECSDFLKISLPENISFDDSNSYWTMEYLLSYNNDEISIEKGDIIYKISDYINYKLEYDDLCIATK